MNSESFRAIYEEHAAFVWRSLRRLGVHPDSIDDLTQEVFLIAFERRDRFEQRSAFRTWLYGIAFNLSRKFALGSARFPSEPVPESLAGGATPQDELARTEAVRLLYAALGTLDAERRAVFVMTELEQMSAPEIAEITGTPLNTVYSRLRLARRDFESALTKLSTQKSGEQP